MWRHSGRLAAPSVRTVNPDLGQTHCHGLEKFEACGSGMKQQTFCTELPFKEHDSKPKQGRSTAISSRSLLGLF
jgi:hypothetical protein